MLLLFARMLGGPWTDRVTFTWPDGPEVLLDLNDIGNRGLFFFGRDEPDLTWALRHILRPGDLFIEAGTSVGLYTAVAAARLGAAGRVIGFEPLQTARMRAEEQLRRNGFTNVRIIPAALGTEPGEASIYLFDHLPIGHASLRDVSPNGFIADTDPVPVRPLDGELSPDERSSVRLIKLDAEGSELPALKGAEETLAESRPYVIFECNRTTMAGFGYGTSDLIGWLEARGMTCHRWTRGIWREADAEELPPSVNLLAVPSERRTEFAQLTKVSQ
jgi:FkbM family methyltransferase